MDQVSIILQCPDKSGFSDSELDHTLQSLISQNYDNWEVILVDSRGAAAKHPGAVTHDKIHHLPGDFKNRASALNQAISQAKGKFILLADNISAQIRFRLSTLELFVLAAQRNSDLGMFYADYMRIEDDDSQHVVHLLDHHPGRVRDNQDYGPVWFIPKKVLEDIGFIDEKFEFADLYRLRLKIAARYSMVHISAKTNGHAYVVKAAAKGHNVFDYLISGKNVQLEMEQALVEHLQEIDAWLPPNTYYNEISYSEAEMRNFDECMASVIIPVFNREEFIATAIESVQAQTIQNIEILIMVNGGADDPTITGVKPYLIGGEKYDPNKPPVHLFVEDINNLGLCFNKGLNHAKGKYYVQLDSDDRLKPDAIEKILAVYDSDPRIGMVIGSYEVWQKDEKTGAITRMEEIPVVTHDEWTEENGRNNLLRINGAGAPRSAHIKVIQELGGFGMNDSPYCRNYGEDYDLVLRMSEKYRIGRVWEPIYDVIRHAGGTDHSIDQLTIDRNDNAKDFMRQEAIKRRHELLKA